MLAAVVKGAAATVRVAVMTGGAGGNGNACEMEALEMER